MNIKINGVTLPVAPKEFSVTTLDLDSEDTVRTANGALNRDRVAVKKQIEASWGPLKWADAADILQAMADVFFEVYYPDPVEGTYVTKTFYAGNRPAPVAIDKNGILYWDGIKVTLTER